MAVQWNGNQWQNGLQDLSVPVEGVKFGGGEVEGGERTERKGESGGESEIATRKNLILALEPKLHADWSTN